jgi:hypothetical protein
MAGRLQPAGADERVAMNSTGRASGRSLRATLIAVAGLTAACSAVPGETLAPRSVQRDVTERILAMAAQGNPQCRQRKISNTEVADLHPDGKVATERWTVDACGRRSNYIVSYSARERGTTFVVREEK